MITKGYRDFCEALWSKWCVGTLNLSQDISDRFQLDHAPEPYLRFGEGSRPLYALFTNPGVGMAHQRRDVVRAGKSCISPDMSYDEASLVLARFYQNHLPKGAARARNQALEHLRALVGADCIVQFESLPFHSKSLPSKHRIPRFVSETPLLHEYVSVLTETLKSVPVVALSAVDSSRSLSAASIAENGWLSWQAALLGVDPRQVVLAPLIEKAGNITSGFIYQTVHQSTRGFVLTMGGNTFPAAPARKIIAAHLMDGTRPV